MNPRSTHHKSLSAPWVPAVAAAGLLGAVFAAGVAGGLGGGAPEGNTTPTATADAATTVEVPTSPAIVSVATTAPIVKTTLDRTLSRGVAGDDVREVQQRLKDLAFDPGPIDGIYGSQTIASVWAYQKLVLQTPRDEATGRVTPDMWSLMQDPIAINPRRPDSTPNHTEIYLPEQVLIVFHDDRPALITHIATGDGEEWCDIVTVDTDARGNKLPEPVDKDVCGISKTPGGVFKFERRVEGIRNGPLGSMFNPVYFNYGIAVHGAINVPLQPASHGCVRIPMEISKYFPDIVADDEQVFVFDGVKDPEDYGRQPPIFDYPNPDATTTTSSTTTTTTLPPTTTQPAPTTTRPAPTTVAPPPTTTTVAATTTTGG